ncbi:MAG: 4-hydroxythreonine-4-phosphate dehydrogenase PdxA [Gammaproteobacteria bacterium]|nr:4-hydroxythreonine-4-phosphate dehydrogenase PdxA [Gammaproteobacteria bacterium]
MPQLPRLLITPGEPAGIGPDICIQLVQDTVAARLAFVVDPEIIRQRAEQLGLPVEIISCDPEQSIPVHQAGTFPVIPIECPQPVIAGQLNKGNAPYVLQTLDCAIDMAISEQVDAIVTAPVHKGIINDAGIEFTGHTEWLAQRTNTPLPVMMLATENLRVALVTTHLPLQQVSQAITHSRLESVIRILHEDLLYKFHIQAPRIRVCGLNPHAGEGGHLGREEIETMEPVIHQLRQEGLDIDGPVPADTAFLPDTLSDTDAILAMYHDQGLPVLKYSGFDQAVNITLGLPIIRTSVDHGTALELAGTGNANASSLIAAIKMAGEMTTLYD